MRMQDFDQNAAVFELHCVDIFRVELP